MTSSNTWLAKAKENRAFSDLVKANKNAGLPAPVRAGSKPSTGFGSGSNNNSNNNNGGGNANSTSVQRFGNNGFRPMQPSLVPVPMRDFTWSDAVYGTKSKGTDTCFIPIRSPSGGPLCTTLTGGGKFPLAIGLKTTEGYKGKMRTRVNFTVDDPEERKALERIPRDVLNYVVNIVDKLYPGYVFQDYTTLVGRVLSEVKPKKEGGGEWPQLASVNTNPDDLFSANTNQAPVLKIINEGTGSQVFDLRDILDQRWKSMTIEWQLLVVGWTEDKETKVKSPLISISRRLRGHMYITVDETSHHYVFPEDEVLHEESECKRKHTIPISISRFRLLEHAKVFEVKQKDQTHSARIEHIDGGNVLIKLTQGGTIPNMFYLETNQQGNLVLTVAIDGPEDEAGLDQLTKDFITMVLERRTEYVKTSTISDGTLSDGVKSILPEKTPNAEKGGFSRSFPCIFEYEKLGTACKIVDSIGQPITDPEKIRGKKWQEYWFTLRSTYVKKNGKLFEIGFSKRFVYLKLQPDANDFIINDERNYEQSSSSTSSSEEIVHDRPPALEEPNSKKARN